MLHRKSSELLMLICEKYNHTGLTEFPSTDIKLDAEDTFLNELEVNGYIVRKRDVSDTIVLTKRTVDFAKSAK